MKALGFCFHPSKEVSEGGGLILCRGVVVRFHPSKEVSEGKIRTSPPSFKKGFHPSKEVSEESKKDRENII